MGQSWVSFRVGGQPDNWFRGKLPPPIRVWIRVSFGVETQFPSGAIVLEPFFTFVLLNEVVPDVETTYFVSIEQKKENCLQIVPGVSAITKDEVICSANK